MKKKRRTPKIEELFSRCPHVATSIFEYLDKKDLNHCLLVNKTWNNFIRNERFTWYKVIEIYLGNKMEMPESWKKALKRTPFKMIKEIALAVHKFFAKSNELLSICDIFHDVIILPCTWSPLHIAANGCSVEAFKYISGNCILKFMF